MKVLSVDIENFLSIEKARVTFDDAGLLLIDGYNHDVDRANGAGKTAILNALSFGLYEKVPRKVTATEVLRRGAKRCTVTVTIQVGDEIFSVTRTRPKGVKFYQIEGTDKVEINLTQAEWESKLRLTYSQFVVSMYCSQANSAVAPRFLLLNDADKKQFLLQLLNLEEFSACKKKADENVNFLLSEINQAQGKINTIQARVDAFSESLVDCDELKLERNGKVEQLKKLIASYNQQQSIPKPDMSKFRQLEEGVLSKRALFAKQKAQREMLMVQWNSLGRKIRPFVASDSCPTCGSHIDNTHAKTIHEAEMAKLQDERMLIKKQIDSIDEILIGESKVEELSRKIAERKALETAEYDKANLSKADLIAKINTAKSMIEILDKKLKENDLLVQKIQALRDKQKEFIKEKESLEQKVEIQKAVSAIYSPTGAQAYVLDSAVALFNEQISKYVDMLWSNLTYELQSHKETVKGDITAKFSESIIMDGKPISLGSLSGGEFRALSICADMALIDLLEQQFGIHMSPVVFDEAFDGLDASGKEFALELIKNLSNDRQVVVIDHASEMRSAFDKVLFVEKRNGISSVNETT